MNNQSDVIVALDFENAEKTYAFLDLFTGRKPFVKVGMELFYSEGPQIVREIKKRGHKIFLDLKLHDIPNTVESAMKVLKNLDVDMTNVHASGTISMMEAAQRGLTKEDGTHAMLLAVTQLTSTSEDRMNNDLLIQGTIENAVKHYALNAKKAGLQGVVCSPLEAKLVKEACGEDFITVTPGIRFASSQADDQRRIMTPEKARLGGSDFIVVGRPITKAEDPVAAYNQCIKEFLNV